MSASSRIAERVLGAIELRDALTQAPLARPFAVRGDGLPITRQRHGLYVIGAPRDPLLPLAAHGDASRALPGEPPLGEVKLTVRVSDPAREYLDTEVVVALPRAVRAGAVDSRFEPVAVPLMRRGSAAVQPHWTVLRVTLLDTDRVTPRAGALLRASAGGRTVDALTGGDGQAVIAFVDQPIFSVVDGSIRRTLALSLSAHADHLAARADPGAEATRLAATPARSTRRVTGGVTGDALAAQALDLPSGETTGLVLVLEP